MVSGIHWTANTTTNIQLFQLDGSIHKETYHKAPKSEPERPWTCLPADPVFTRSCLGSVTWARPFVNHLVQYMPSRGGQEPPVVVVAVAQTARRRRTRRRHAIMPVKSSASFRLTALPMVVLAQLLAAAVFTLTLVWVLHFRGGVSLKRTSGPLLVYTAHPLFMVLGFIICTGEALMAYRMVLGPRAAKKAVHMLLHLIALAFAAVGLYATFKFHRDLGLPDIRSLHAWLGIATVALYALQWLVAFVYFVFPGAVMTMRADYAPWHIFFGIVIFLMAICTAETGLAKFVFAYNEALLVSFTGIAILMFGVVVVLAVILPSRY